MPHRKQIDCSNGKIYKIISNNPDVKEVYYGSTIQTLCGRMTGHRANYKRWLEGKGGGCASYDLFEKYGIEQFHIELVELFPCDIEAQLYARENEYIRSNECVNKNSAIRTPKELKEWHKKYKQEHKEEKKEQNKKYQQEHKEEKKEKNKKYRQDHKDELTQKITCECGCEISKGYLTQHLKTKKHLLRST